MEIIDSDQFTIVEGLVVQVEYFAEGVIVGVRGSGERNKLWIVGTDGKDFQKLFKPGLGMFFIHFYYPCSCL